MSHPARHVVAAAAGTDRDEPGVPPAHHRLDLGTILTADIRAQDVDSRLRGAVELQRAGRHRNERGEQDHSDHDDGAPHLGQ